ncbi:MAG: DUF5606 domain-containing protein [Prevotellaceae bacterium]|jgi:hypothetical protein|nr:DUF5606 domain-containing protein [Prevotellaceae bacterium]
MELKEIMSVTGQPGLFKYVSKGRNGLIVESLLDNRRCNIPPAAKVSTLSDIAVFTSGEEVPLGKVLLGFKEKCAGQPAIDPKVAKEDEVRAFLASVLPDYDKDRVYLSDIKKMVMWYNLLQKCDMLDFEVKDKKKEEEASADAEKTSAASTSAAPSAAAKSTPKKPGVKPVPHASSKAAGSAGKVNAPRKAQ